MLLPTFFKSINDEYEHLKKDVQLWDVSVQRQIEINGKDSYKLVQLMTCRDLSKAKVKKCYYVPLVDKNGNMINDPLIMKISEEKWRICIADSDVLLFAKGISDSYNLDIKIHETNICTLAIQGPKSDSLMKKIFGNKIIELKFFNYDYYNFKGSKFLVSKSGFSKQGGYEIHIEDIASGLKFYDHCIESGKEFNLKPGCPNAIERIESGLLSYGNDMDNEDNPYECGFDKFINVDNNINFLGKDSLKKIRTNGIKKKLMGVKIEMRQINLIQEEKLHDINNNLIGFLRSAAFSPKFNKVVGIAMIYKEYCNQNQKFIFNFDNKKANGIICNLPII